MKEAQISLPNTFQIILTNRWCKLFWTLTEKLKPYRNAFVLQMNYRFNKGKNKKMQKHSEVEIEKRVYGGADF